MSSDAIYHDTLIKKDESMLPDIKHFTNEFDIDRVSTDA